MKGFRPTCIFSVLMLYVADLIAVHAWHAIPHLLIGSVARMSMTPLAQRKIDYILSLWSGQYPRQSTLERACVWLDDINMKTAPRKSDITRRFDYLQIFKNMHGANKPYNPQKIKLKGLNAHLPVYERTAIYLLDMAFNNLLETSPSMRNLEDLNCQSTSTNSLTLNALSDSNQGNANSLEVEAYDPKATRRVPAPPASAENRTHFADYVPQHVFSLERWKIEDPDPLKPLEVGTILSLNLYLRIVLHLLGDIHQPLHSMLAFSKAFPDGDGWGTEITVELPDGERTNLHRFWDSGGNLYLKRASEMTDEEIKKEAEMLMEKYPINEFMDFITVRLLAPNFDAIVQETYDLGKQLVYKEIKFSSLKSNNFIYMPSDSYIADAQEASKRQIVLAGYRLGHALQVISKYLPYPEKLDE